MAKTNKDLNRRLELHSILEEVLGSKNVYFQPPESKKLSYPCVVYHRETGRSNFANNKTYMFSYRYQIIYIDRDPDSDFPTRLMERLPKCIYDRHYTADNLNHEALNLYY